MSYEGNMLKELRMPSKREVAEVLLKILFKHNGTIKEFAAGEEIVNEIADYFSLNKEQRDSVLERTYKKENRIVKTPLWHRLLYRAADSLAKRNLIIRPNETFFLTNRKEWMLTEDGYNKAIDLLEILDNQRDTLLIKSYEVQKWVNEIKQKERPTSYDLFEKQIKKKIFTKEQRIRIRGFRQVVVESYENRCSVCGLKIHTPDYLNWEVEAAHIVPHNKNGRDDIWNGIALCRLHHWAFDSGWFSLSDDYKIIVSSRYNNIPDSFGKFWNCDFIKESKQIVLPKADSLSPHQNAIKWHRENILYK